MARLGRREFMAVTLPFIFSTLTQPLLSSVNTAIVGRLNNVSYIAGVSVGMTMINTICWLFGFLRVATTGRSAQSYGKKLRTEQIATLVEPAVMGTLIGVVFVLLQQPIFQLSAQLLSVTGEVARFAETYYMINIWALPVILVNYSVLGWLMGQRQIKASVMIQVGSNLLNVLLDFVFVGYFSWGIQGVALAGLLSQSAALLFGISIAKRLFALSLKEVRPYVRLGGSKELFSGNLDLMIRTICLLIQLNFFTAESAQFSAVILSANSILYQIQNVMSYLYDGIANGASFFAGQSKGAGDAHLMKDAWRYTLFWTAGAGVLLTVCFALFHRFIFQLFTNLPSVLAACERYWWWLVIFPFVSGLGFTVYGIFTGCGVTRPVRDSTILSLLLFFALWYGLKELGNTALWAAVLGYYGGKGIFLLPYWRQTMIVMERKEV